MSDHQGKYLPVSRPGSEPYWAACSRHELLIQRCNECQTHQFYPRVLCVNCSSRTLEWVQASGRAKVVTWTIIRRAVSAAYAADVPYVIALIKLQEGPVMMSKVTDCELSSVYSGMSVEVRFEDWSEQLSIPVFVPASA